MKRAWWLVAVMMAPLIAAAQGTSVPAGTLVPRGTLLPVSLDHGLSARKARAGQTFRAEVMQNIPGTPVRRRAHVVGHVLRAETGPQGQERLVLGFDAVLMRGRRIPLRANLRALASFLEVEDAEIPEEAMDRGMTPEQATYEQIGGEQVYRGGGPVARGNEPVGRPTPYGVLAVPRGNPERACQGAVGGDQPQALWVFSTDACGVYGLPDVRIEHAGRTDPVGTVVLAAEHGKLEIRSGAGMLLRVE